MEKKAMYWDTTTDGKVSCRLCPHNCVIAPGRTGICRVRINREGVLYSAIYGEVSSIQMDPIEKKPLYHFYPGSSILSVGTVGCSFRCKFCQNYTISQNPDHSTDFYSPKDLISLAVRKGSTGIAYTYTEPLIWYEWVLECCKYARKEGLKNVFVTNGYINTEPLLELLPFADAFNIDLKSFSETFYRKLVMGKLDPVLETIAEVSKRKEIVLEVTTLVIPGYNDSEAEIEKITGFLASMRSDIPYHLSAYYPAYQFTAPPTPVRTLARLKKTAEKKLHYVYLGNVGEPSNTCCHNCGTVLIKRQGYYIERADYENGVCKKCGVSVPIIG